MTALSGRAQSEVTTPGTVGGDAPSLSTQVRKGAIWVVASNLLLRLANVLLTAVVARILAPHDFGVYAVALTAYAIISSVGELGLSACLIRADLDIDALGPTVATVSVLSSAVFAGAMAALAGPIATALGSADAVQPIRVLAIAVLLLGVFAVPTSQMTRDFKQDKIFLANVIAFVPSTAVLIILAESGTGALAFAWSMVVRQLTVGIVLLIVAPRYYRPGLSRPALSVIVTFGMPLAAANFVNFSLLNVDYAFVGHLLGAAALGFYMLAFTVASWPSALLGGVINSVSMPAFSRVKHDPDLLKDAIATAVRGVTLIVLPICAMMIALARPLVLTLYGVKWVAVASVLAILAPYSAVFMLCLLFANMLTGLGKTKPLLVLQVVWIGTLVPAMVWGVHRDGILGAAYAHVAVIVPVVLPAYLVVLRRATGVRLRALGRAVLPGLSGSSAAAMAAYAAESRLSSPLGQLLAGLAAGGIVYLLYAGRPGIEMFGGGRAAERVLRWCAAPARLAGFGERNRARHSARHGAAWQDVALESPSESDDTLTQQNLPRLNADRVENLAFGDRGFYRYPQSDRQRQALAVHERALADQELRHGPDHPHTLAARTNLAHAYRVAGQLAKSIALYEQTLSDWKRQLGPDHLRTIRTSNYLAAAYREAGRLADAIPLYEQALQGRRRMLGADHPSTLRSCAYMVRTYLDAGRPADAIPICEEVVQSQRRVLGADHPSTLTSCVHLLRAYLDADRPAEVISLGEDVVERQQRVLGKDHPSTLRSCLYLARGYVGAGRAAEAIRLCERALAHSSRVLGVDSMLTRSLREGLSDAAADSKSSPDRATPAMPSR